ncbi:ABC-three component system middle component 8 [Clostridium cadaveris]|uniref:ABC-three component system middle component 8 n=1 Tax=Clostridium cadaveris TaxID=1529 RepID=UPI000C085815|nr:ABC-three component system middle component 8 [Clostridium cadaveris]
MIKPTKFLNLNTCILKISSEILSILIEEKSITFSDLQSKLLKDSNEDYEYNFLPSIDFLFLLGKIKYSPKTDILELIQ